MGIDKLGEEIDALREEKQRLLLQDANRAGMQQQTTELEAFLDKQQTKVTEYGEALVRKLIERITVYDDRLVFEFKTSLENEVQM